MWLFLSRRLRLFLLVAILLPLVSSLARRWAERYERTHAGPTRGSRSLRLVENSAGWARGVLR